MLVAIKKKKKSTDSAPVTTSRRFFEFDNAGTETWAKFAYDATCV